MLRKAEQAARDCGLSGIYLWTQSWQAPDFHPKLGFEQFAELIISYPATSGLGSGNTSEPARTLAPPGVANEDEMAEAGKATASVGGLLRGDRARMVVEIHVSDLKASLLFWRDLLGFATAFERPEERFVYLEHPEGHQIMLCQRHGRFETGPLDFPLGQGAMFQFYFGSIARVLSALEASSWPIYLGPREVWRRTGDYETGQKEVFIQDPDGYLLMIAENIGRRSLTGAIGL